MAFTATPGAFTPINMFAMLRNLINQNAPILTNAGAPTNGTSGTYVNQAGPGAIIIDITNGNLYMNTNTIASPTWTRIGGTSGAVLASPVFSGTATGTYTLGGTPTISSPTINTPTISSIKSAFSTATVSAGYSSDTYLAGSGIAVPTGGFVAGARYGCVFDMVKTAAGSAQFTITLRIGTLGTTADAAILTFAFAVGTAAADTGTFEVWAHFRTVGATTTAVLVGTADCFHALAATGLITTGASGQGQITVVSSGFDSTIAGTTIGLSVNGGASFSGTNTIVEAELHSF